MAKSKVSAAVVDETCVDTPTNPPPAERPGYRITRTIRVEVLGGGARGTSEEDIDAGAEAIYSAIAAHHAYRYPRAVAHGEPFVEWSRLTEFEQAGYRNAAFVILSSVEPPPDPEPEP